INRPAGAEIGPALGAARLALLSLGLPRDSVLAAPMPAQSFNPDRARSMPLLQRLARYREAYAPLRALS
ncbi:MAG: xylulokinase, partial [Rhizobacter sp.]|nr:xylulokinase [Rhizobacter sp.]